MQMLKCFRLAHGHIFKIARVWRVTLTSPPTAASILDCPRTYVEGAPQKEDEEEKRTIRLSRGLLLVVREEHKAHTAVHACSYVHPLLKTKAALR